jgi:hypothetical protein
MRVIFVGRWPLVRAVASGGLGGGHHRAAEVSQVSERGRFPPLAAAQRVILGVAENVRAYPETNAARV